MDLRAPLPAEEHCIFPPKDDDTPTIVLEPTIKYLLCRIYLATQMMELGSESRFTSIILFRRYVGHFNLMHQNSPQQHQGQKGRKRANANETQQSVEEMKQIKRHLGRIAAACIFLGCKTEEEPRRIRDVINLSSILDFEVVGRKCSTPTTTDINDNANQSKLHKQTTQPLEIIDSKHPPPPLDDKYWSDKEQMVSTEQQLLRMLQFDTLVCHPYRCVLIVMDTLNFGRGTKSKDQKNSLLSPRASEALIFKAWTILNEISIDAVLGTKILRFDVVTLACAVISVAAASNHNYNNGDNATLPDEWWRALDVATNDVMSASESIRHLLHEKGRTSCSEN
jgi:hypothetical protein